MPAPRRLHEVEAPPIPEAASTLDALWLAGTHLLPAMDLGVRFEAWALLWTVATCLVTTFFAHQLFRGPGRQLAAIGAGLVCAVGLSSWIQHVPAREVFPDLPFTVLALASLTALIRPLVRLGRLTPVAMVRALAAASGAAVVMPGPGLPLLALVALVTVLRGRGTRDAPVLGRLRSREERARDPEPQPSASQSRASRRGVLHGRPVVIALLGLSPLLTTGPFLLWHLDLAATQPLTMEAWLRQLHLGLAVTQLTTYVSAQVVFPGLALLLLLLAPLRWRGGLTIVAFTGLSLLVFHGDAPLTPWPVLVALISVAAAGWLWLAGTLVDNRAQGLVFAAAATALLVGLSLVGIEQRRVRPGPAPLADLRPEAHIDRFLELGLVASGDVLLLHDDDLRETLARSRYLDGFRPDLLVVDPRPLDTGELRIETFAWVADGRRVLSDSFNMGGRWLPFWSIESGPLYWFVFDPQKAVDQPFTFSVPLDRPVSDAFSRTYARHSLERARYRRAIQQPSVALHALSRWADPSDDWATATRTAEALRLPADVASELPLDPRLPTRDHTTIDAWPQVDAEMGDMLFALGDTSTGAALLIRAGERGYFPAYGTLVRWELRAGDAAAARQHLRQLANDPELRPQALTLLSWLAADGTAKAAVELRDHLDAAPPHPEHGELGDIEELGARLAVLERLAQPPAPAVSPHSKPDATPPATPDSAAADEALEDERREEDGDRRDP